MELLMEILFEIYLELMMLVVPEEKAATKKYRVLSVLVATVVLLSVLALLIWGWILLFEQQNLLGILPLAAGAILSVAQIVAGVILHCRKGK